MVHFKHAAVAGGAVMRAVGFVGLAFFAEARGAGGFYCDGAVRGGGCWLWGGEV